MKIHTYILLFGLALTSCAEVPKEATQLSQVIGQDITSMKSSHQQLVRELFRQLKKNREDYIQNEWTPDFLQQFIKEGRLKDIANGRIVWSAELNGFRAPNPDKAETELHESIQTWAEETTYQIQKKRSELLTPLEEQETLLLGDLDQAYNQMINANSEVTAYLRSLADIQDFQNEVLDIIGVREFRDKVNQRIQQASILADKGLDEIKEIDRQLQGAN